MTHHHVNTGSLWTIGCVHFTALPASDCELEARLSDCKIINNGGFNTLPPPLYCKIRTCSFFNGPERTYCSCGRGVQVDDASYVRAHWINGGVRSKPKVVDAQIGGALIHHLTDHVHFHLQKQNNSTNDFQRILISTALLKTAICRSCAPSGVFLVTQKSASVTSVLLSPVSIMHFTYECPVQKSNQIHARVSHPSNG